MTTSEALQPHEKLMAQAVCPNCGAGAADLRGVYLHTMTVKTVVRFPMSELQAPEAVVLQPEIVQKNIIEKADVGQSPPVFQHVHCGNCLQDFPLAAMRYKAVTTHKHPTADPASWAWNSSMRFLDRAVFTRLRDARNRLKMLDKTYPDTPVPTYFYSELNRIEKEERNNSENMVKKLESLRLRIIGYFNQHRLTKDEHDRSVHGNVTTRHI